MQTWTQSCLPDRWIVLGQRLQPFCIGHYLLLQRYRVPFVEAEDTAAAPAITPRALLLAVYICARQPGVAQRGLERGLGLRFGLLALLIMVWFRVRPYAFVGAVGLFVHYVRANSAIPTAFFPEPKARPPGAPLMLGLKHRLMAIGYSSEEATTMPLCQAWWEVLSEREREGAVELANRIEAEALKD